MAASTALKGGQIRDFSGGPNLRDSPPQLAGNEVEDAWNITFDERGGAGSRLGYQKYNGTTFDAANLVKNVWWSTLLSTTITQVGTKLYKGTSTTSVKTFTTNALVTFAELNSLLIACHPVDGLFTSSDGVTWTAVADPDAPKGVCCAVWQNKLFVGDSTGKVSYSAPGDATTWASTDFNKLWEKDQQGIVALHIGSGQDILGKPGLLAFKQESTYRINDSATGAYTTVDATVGAAGPLAVVGVGARVITISRRGICWFREDQSGMVNASDLFLPLWAQNQIDFTQQQLWCAGRKGNRALFSLTRHGSTANDLAIEFHPDQDWLAPGSNAMSCYTTAKGTDETLYGGSPTVDGQVYELETGGDDDGSPISWRLQTRWVELNSGFQGSLWQVRIHGLGDGTMTVRTDYASSGGDGFAFALDPDPDGGSLYDSGVDYDTGVSYSSPLLQNTEPFFSLGVCRQFSLLFTGSSSTTQSAAQLLGAGTSPEIGAFALYGLEWLFVPLGLS